MPSLEQVKEEGMDEVNPWKLFKFSEIRLATQLLKKVTETLTKFSSIDLNSISHSDKNVLLSLSDNSVPYDWRKVWQGPKLASEYLKAVAIRVQTVSKFLGNLDDAIQEVDFSRIFNVDSFLSTMKLVTSRELKVSTSDLILSSFTDPIKQDKSKLREAILVTVAPLLIDGLNFDNDRLVQSDGSNTSNFTSSIFLYYKENTKSSMNGEPGTYAVPVYATNSREKLLCTINLNTSLEKEDIIYSGTSLIVPAN